MGNRAVITTSENFYNNGVGVYLHWNGGRDSVEGFLKYCELRGFRTPQTDSYAWARLAQIISNFMGGDGLSIGLDTCDKLDCDNYDNGVYFIKGWKIVGREYLRGLEQHEYDLFEMLTAIDHSQPAEQQIGDELLKELFDNETDLMLVEPMYYYKVSHGKDKDKFEVGKSYGITSAHITVLSISDDNKTMTVRYGSWNDAETEELTIPIYHWKNGNQSTYIKREGCIGGDIEASVKWKGVASQ